MSRPPEPSAGPTACPRLDRLPLHDLPGGLRLGVARSPRARMLGLAWLDDMPEECGLLLPRCGSVHTFGMRFPLDVILLDRSGSTLRVAESIPRRRFVGAPRARTVIETRAGRADAFLAAGAAGVATSGDRATAR